MASPGGSRELFSSRAGFILAAVGSAVGLGNMWRFSYQASEGGGAAFVLLYVVITILLGIPIMMAEFALGRRGQLAPVGTLRKLVGRAWAPVGWLFAIGVLVILSYYSVIAGWTMRYAFEAVVHGFPEDAGQHFGRVASGGGAIAYHLAFMLATLLIVMGGVRAGIERASMILMPALFVIVAGLAIWAMTLPDAGEGYSVYLMPDLDQLTNPTVWRAAAAQAFFSLGLGMGVMMTFASYLDRSENLPQSGTIIAFSDFGVAFVAGLVVFPVIYSFGLQGAVGESTVGALFIALPSAFDAMGLPGHVVGLFFFVVLAVGALTSAISLLEMATASIIDELRLSRRTAAAGAAVLVAAMGVLPALSLDALGLMDKIAGELLLVAGALIIALLAGWRLHSAVREELLQGTSPWWAVQVPRILAVLRWVVPPIVVGVLAFSARDTWSAITAFLQG